MHLTEYDSISEVYLPSIREHCCITLIVHAAFDLDRKPTVKCPPCGSDFRPSIVWFRPGMSRNDWCPPSAAVVRPLEFNSVGCGAVRQRAKSTHSGR